MGLSLLGLLPLVLLYPVVWLDEPQLNCLSRLYHGTVIRVDVAQLLPTEPLLVVQLDCPRCGQTIKVPQSQPISHQEGDCVSVLPAQTWVLKRRVYRIIPSYCHARRWEAGLSAEPYPPLEHIDSGR
jgi:hypothetical protein